MFGNKGKFWGMGSFLFLTILIGKNPGQGSWHGCNGCRLFQTQRKPPAQSRYYYIMTRARRTSQESKVKESNFLTLDKPFREDPNWIHMKKKLAHRTHHRHSVVRAHRAQPHYLVVVKGWMFLVAFAMMLGLGAMVGNFINQQLNQSTPQVAGATTTK